MNGDRLHAAADRYRQAAAMHGPPPPVSSDATVDGGAPIEQLLRVLGLAANADDPMDEAQGAQGYAQRDAWATEAAAAFTGQDNAAASQLSSIAGAVAGAITGVLQPLSQLPQQMAQGATQAVQAAVSLVGQSDAGATTDALTDTGIDSRADDFGADGDPGEVADSGVSGSGGVSDTLPANGATAPMGVLGPAPVPSAATHPSAGTGPSAAQAVVRATPVPMSAPAMTGMPMMPPSAMPGSAADTKGETKRVATPSVHNGAPVQGRLTPTAADPAVSTRIDGRPVATRRARAEESAAEAL